MDTANKNNAKILIADDDPEILALLSIRLRKLGYQVLEASDGQQVMHLLQRERPDLLLLDVMMPGRNGWEVAREVRGRPELQQMGILMVTAIGERVNEATSPLYGADDYVDKPFDFALLAKKIQQVLAKRSAAGTA